MKYRKTKEDTDTLGTRLAEEPRQSLELFDQKSSTTLSGNVNTVSYWYQGMNGRYITDQSDTVVRCTVLYCAVLFFLLVFSSHLLSSAFYSLSLLVVTQIRGHIAGSSPPLPTTVRALHFLSREDFSSFFPRRLASNCAYPR